MLIKGTIGDKQCHACRYFAPVKINACYGRCHCTEWRRSKVIGLMMETDTCKDFKAIEDDPETQGEKR